MAELDSQYNRAAGILESAHSESDAQHRRDLYEAAILAAEELLAARDDAETRYLAGLSWYHFPESSARRAMEVSQHLERAVKADPGHQLARLYLGYHHFDEGRYQDALTCFAALDLSYFTRLNGPWRNLKTAELVLACKLYLSRGNLPIDQVEEVASRYLSADEEDRVVPVEIVRCVSDLIKRGTRSAALRETTKVVATMVEDLGYQDLMYGDYEVIRGALPKTIAASQANIPQPQSGLPLGDSGPEGVVE